MKQGQIISAFPMTGKTYCGNTYQNIIDLWRTPFKHILSEEDKKVWVEASKWILKEINPEWPNNYKEAILEAQHTYDVVLVNEAILETLRANDIPYSVVTPTINCKDEYIERMRQRGNNDILIQKLSANFEKYITENREDSYAEHIYTLQQWQYLSDLFEILQIPLIKK